MSIKDFMVNNGNNRGGSNNNVVVDQNIEQDVEENAFDLSDVGYDDETNSFFSKEETQNVENVNPSPNVTNTQPSNFNITQLPEFVALQQQNQQLQNQLLQVVQHLQQQPRQTQQQQPQFDINQVMSDPQQFQQFMEHNNKNIVNHVLQTLQPRIQQYDSVANNQIKQQQLQSAYQQAQANIPDFEQVIGTDVNKALNYVKKYGSFIAAYDVMKAENAANGNQPSRTVTRKQRISRVENGSNTSQQNSMSLNKKVYDPNNSARDSALAALDEILNKR